MYCILLCWNAAPFLYFEPKTNFSIEDTWKFAYATCYLCKHYFATKFIGYYSIRLLRVRVKAK